MEYGLMLKQNPLRLRSTHQADGTNQQPGTGSTAKSV